MFIFGFLCRVGFLGCVLIGFCVSVYIYFSYVAYDVEFLRVDEVFQYDADGYVDVIFYYVVSQVDARVGFCYADYGFDVSYGDGDVVCGLRRRIVLGFFRQERCKKNGEAVLLAVRFQGLFNSFIVEVFNRVISEYTFFFFFESVTVFNVYVCYYYVCIFCFYQFIYMYFRIYYICGQLSLLLSSIKYRIIQCNIIEKIKLFL